MRNNSSLESLSLLGNQVGSACDIWLFVGLQPNQHIRELSMEYIRLGNNCKLHLLGPFLTDNPSLQKLSLRDCFIGPAEVDILADQLLARSADTLQELDLSCNDIGPDADLQQLVLALKRSRSLKRLNLANTHIGSPGASSLAELLLGNGGCNSEGLYLDPWEIETSCLSLQELNVSGNNFRAGDCLSLAGALADNNRNTKLKTLNLKSNGWLTVDNWSGVLRRVLHLVCDRSDVQAVVNSNHKLSSLADPYDPDDVELGEELTMFTPWQPVTPIFNTALGVEDANLLRASFELNNGPGSDMVKARKKILMLHIRGHLNLGDTPLDMGIVPTLVGLFGEDWCRSRFPQSLILDATFRVIRSMTHSYAP